MTESPPHVLRLCNNAFDTVNPDDVDEVRSIWAAFSKAKDAIADGKRLEYLSWRLYSQRVLSARETSATQPPFEEPKAPQLSESMSTSTLSSPPMLDMSSSSESIQSCKSRPSFTSKQLSQLFLPQQDHLTPNLLRQPRAASRSNESFKSVPSMASIAYSQSMLNMALQEKTPPRTRQAEKSAAKTSGINIPLTHPEPCRSVSFRDVSASPSLPARGRQSDVNLASSTTRAVRGFSPSNISVAVNYSSQNLAAQAGSYASRSNVSIPRASSRLSQNQQLQSSSQQKLSTDGSPHLGWSKASIPRNKMFFIESSTDSEAGSASSVESVLHDDEPLSSSQRSGRAGLKVTFAHMSGEEESEGSIHYYHTDEDSEVDVGDDSEWDDLDEEVDDEVDPAVEQQELLFNEREVPIRPAITRSHLSSLFLKKLENVEASSTPGPSDENETPAQATDVKVPANILLDAHVANHYPLQNEINSNCIPEENFMDDNVNENELSQSIRDNLKLSRDYDLESLWAVKRSNGARSRSRSSSASRQNSQTSWLHSSEDIFDPLNYHSRGW